MRAARCLEYGPPSSVVVVDVPEPVPSEGQVVVDIAAAAVNFPDVLLVADQYQMHIPVPFTVGSEFAGTVRAVGAGVDGVAVGDRVMGSTMFGAFAEQIAVPASSLQPVDPAVELATAAASGVAHATAYHALRSVARVQPGEWVVVLGAAGGVGLAAVELGAVLGARMVAAASSAEKMALCLARGAEVADRLHDRGPQGAGQGDHRRRGARGHRSGRRGRTPSWRCGPCAGVAGSSRSGSPRGRFPGSPSTSCCSRASWSPGSPWRDSAATRREDRARDMAELAALARAGRATPYISATYPLEQVGRALSDLAERRATGKVLVEPTR